MTETPFTVCIMAPESARLKERLDGLLAGGEMVAPTVEVLESVDSTNRYLLEMAATAGDGPQACVAMNQTAGRGRRGRTWHARPGASLALSLAWPVSRGRVPPSYPVGVGIGVIQALESLGLEGVRLKWPNDLMLDGAKLGGILVEQRMPGPDRPGWLVAGIGLNREAADTLGLERAVTDLASHVPGGAPEWLELAARVIEQQCRLHPVLLREGIAPLDAELERIDLLRGQAIEVLDDGAHARAVGIDPASGCLVAVFDDGAVRHLHSGEVSVRGCEHG